MATDEQVVICLFNLAASGWLDLVESVMHPFVVGAEGPVGSDDGGGVDQAVCSGCRRTGRATWVAFVQREGWRVLGYPTLRHCLADRLTMNVDSVSGVIRAATTKS